MATTEAYSLAFLSEYLNCEYMGDASCKVTGLAPLAQAGASHITFLAQDKYAGQLENCAAAIVVLKAEYKDCAIANKLIVEDPYLAYARISRLFEPRIANEAGVHASAIVDPTATIPESVAIGPNCVVGANVVIGAGSELSAGCVIGDDSSIGENCLLHANVTLYHGIRIGNDVLIHSGTVIGSDGFGFAPSKQEGWVKIHQLGTVRVGNGVEIGSNVSIDRGALNDTIIEDGVIIDNLVHIAHGVKIGERTAVAGCVGIAGSTTVGKNCTIAGAVAINGHIEIADNSHFHGGTIVTKGNSEPGAFASIPPVQDVKSWRRNSVRYTQLDEMAARLRKLEKALKQ